MKTNFCIKPTALLVTLAFLLGCFGESHGSSDNSFFEFDFLGCSWKVDNVYSANSEDKGYFISDDVSSRVIHFSKDVISAEEALTGVKSFYPDVRASYFETGRFKIIKMTSPSENGIVGFSVIGEGGSVGLFGVPEKELKRFSENCIDFSNAEWTQLNE